MFSIVFALGLFQLALGSIDPRTGIWAAPPAPDAVFYEVDPEPMTMGFPEIPPPMKQEWKDLNAPAVFGRTSFKYKYVTRGGQVHDSNPGMAVEVAATTLCSETGHAKGAQIVAVMLANIGDDVWLNMVKREVRVGIFSRHEALSVYPEYNSLADSPGCKDSCRGSCKRTCTFDGRKWDTVAGAGGVRAAILESNILCDRYDPYRRGNNILAHEFIHTIHMNGLPYSTRSKVDSAFNNAKRRKLWRSPSYAMSTAYEYFAEAGGVWFNVNHNGSSGGMDKCSSEQGCRSHLKSRDRLLHELLKYTFSPRDENKPGNLKICV